MPLTDTLSFPGSRIAAWDRSSSGAGKLTIVGFDRERAEVIARDLVPAQAQSALEEQLVQHGILIGGTYRGCGFFWVIDDSYCLVVGLDRGIAAEMTGRLLLAAGQRIAIEDIRAVISFVNETNVAHRGVKLQLDNGSEVMMAEQYNSAAEFDPTYGRTNLEIDAGWIVRLGSELAAHLRVTHYDELWDTVTPPAAPQTADSSTTALLDGMIAAHGSWDDPAKVAERDELAQAKAKRDSAVLSMAYIKSGQRGELPLPIAVAKMADHFAGRMDRELTVVGAFPAIHQPLPELENGGYIVLDLKPLEGASRVLELRVESPSGANKADEVVLEGTNGEVAQFLRSAALPETLISIMERLTEATRDS